MAKRRFKTNFKKSVKRDSERQQQAASGFGYLNLPEGVSKFTPEPGGKIKLDIIPYIVSDKNHPDRYEDEGIAVEGELWYKRPFQIHRGIGVSKDTVVCPRSFGKKCPVCDYRDQQLGQGAEWDDVKDLKASDRNLYAVVPVGSKDYDRKIHIWDMSQHLFQRLLNDELEEDEDYAAFPDLEEGLTLRIRFDSKTIGDSKPFPEASRIDFDKRKKPYPEAILDDVPDLDTILEVLSYKELEAKFMELDEEDLADEDDTADTWEEEDEAPKRKKKSAAKKKKKPEPEPEEESWDDEDIDEAAEDWDGWEEDEVEDDWDEDWGEDEDEDDEQPW